MFLFTAVTISITVVAEEYISITFQMTSTIQLVPARINRQSEV
jgi:hypothetical protein